MIPLLILLISSLIVLVVATLSSVGTFFVVFYIMNKSFGRRCDGYAHAYYFTAEDYPELSRDGFSFLSNKKQRLYGYLYHREGIEPKGLIIFLHGIGAGHVAYTRLINRLADSGNIIMAFDYTGCGMSEGRSMKSMIQGVVDLEYALKYIDQNDEIKKLPRYAIGHSWGGFLALNVLNIKDSNVLKVVSLAGFDTQTSAITTLKEKKQYLAVPFAFLNNLFHYGKYALYSSKKALKRTSAEVLYIQGEQDRSIKPKYSGEIFQKIALNKRNIKVEIIEGKMHNCYLSKRAQDYQTAMIKKYGIFRRPITDGYKIDYDLLTELDENLMKQIIDFIG
ncbi:MAG: alpha/beta fold hydrolase [Bacilli bacterium]|jgi:hypothetical protein